MSTVETLQKQVNSIAKEQFELAAVVEHLHFSLAQLLDERTNVFKIVLESACEGLGVEKHLLMHKDAYHATWLPPGRGLANKAITEQAATRARVIMIFFLRFIFCESHGSITLNFSWFSKRQEQAIRRMWAGVLEPKTPFDQLLRNETIKVQGIVSKKIKLNICI